MDAGLRTHFLNLLAVDLWMAERFPEQFLSGPEVWEAMVTNWRRNEAMRKLLRYMEDQPSVDDHQGEHMRGGIITCDCQCHVPIGPGFSREGRPTSCIHCRLIA